MPHDPPGSQQHDLDVNQDAVLTADDFRLILKPEGLKILFDQVGFHPLFSRARHIWAALGLRGPDNPP